MILKRKNGSALLWHLNSLVSTVKKHAYMQVKHKRLNKSKNNTNKLRALKSNCINEEPRIRGVHFCFFSSKSCVFNRLLCEAFHRMQFLTHPVFLFFLSQNLNYSPLSLNLAIILFFKITHSEWSTLYFPMSLPLAKSVRL